MRRKGKLCETARLGPTDRVRTASRGGRREAGRSVERILPRSSENILYKLLRNASRMIIQGRGIIFCSRRNIAKPFTIFRRGGKDPSTAGRRKFDCRSAARGRTTNRGGHYAVRGTVLEGERSPAPAVIPFPREVCRTSAASSGNRGGASDGTNGNFFRFSSRPRSVPPG